MTDPVIPRAAIVATTEARYAHRDASGPHGAVKCRCGQSFRTGVEQLQHASHAILTAALPHLRPLVEAQELRLATEVALKLGRQEALAEIADEMELSEPWQWTDTRFRYVDVQIDKESWRLIKYARDTGKGDS